ncbi:MAG: metallophosphoesterase [Lachnospiraceae bacterium]|nr:metallophosphoesterase [Lachnospiraceae bacterium]
MKKIKLKKGVISLLAGVFFILLFSSPIYAAGEGEGQALHCREDGSFHILVIADTQDLDKPQKLTTELLNAELDAADADLVIFLGDMIFGPHLGRDQKKVEAAIRAVIDPVAERNIPFAIVFGNHDDEESLSREEQFAVYQSYSGCLNEDPDLPGVGNTYLPLYAENSGTPSILLWLMDSGSYAEEEIGGYGYVKEEQNQWFRDSVASYGEENRPVSYVFQHIVVPQVFSLVEPAKAFEKGAFCTFGKPWTDWYTEREGAVREGRFGESPCPPLFDSGQFESWKDCGVKAAFFGHDHANDYIADVDGIDFVATCGLGFYSYGRGDEHGARLLILHADRPEEYETKMVYYKDLIGHSFGLTLVPYIGRQYVNYLYMIIAGLILLICVVVLIVRILKKRKKRKKEAAALQSASQGETQDASA